MRPCCMIISQMQCCLVQSRATSKGEEKWDKVGVSDKWPCTAGGWMEWSGTRTTKMMAFCFLMFWQQLIGDIPTISQTLQNKLSFSKVESHKSLSADELQTWEHVFGESKCKHHWIYQLILQICSFLHHGNLLNPAHLLALKKI